MTLDQTLDALRELGVSIPQGLDDAQLTNQAKALCPWKCTVQPVSGQPWAFEAVTNPTKRYEVGYGNTEAEACMQLLLKQLNGKRYSALDTRYKLDARARFNN